MPRLSAEAPVPVVEIREWTWAPGGAANVAANLVDLGATVALAGVIGNDPPAAQLKTALRSNGVDTHGLLPDRARATPTKSRLIASGQ